MKADTHTIYHDLVIEAPIAKVYEAISQPSGLVNWWPQQCTGIPKKGEEYNFFFTQEYDWYGEVEKAEENRAFHIKMTKSDKDWDPTSFGFDLKESDGKVYVCFVHKNWPSCNEHFRFSSFFWALLLNGLKNYVEKGVIVPFEERS